MTLPRTKHSDYRPQFKAPYDRTKVVWKQYQYLYSLPIIFSAFLKAQAAPFTTGHRMSDSLARQILTTAGIFVGKTTRLSDLQLLVKELRVLPTKRELIRIGPDSDGGYLFPDDLDGVRHCFSPGVPDCREFELDLANRGMDVFMADRSTDLPPIIRDFILKRNFWRPGMLRKTDFSP